MYDIELMDVLYSCDDLLEEFAGLFFGYALLLNYVVK